MRFIVALVCVANLEAMRFSIYDNNMYGQNGFVKLWRKSIDSQVFKNAELWKVWTWCIMKANHKTEWVEIKTGSGKSEVEVLPGQFIYGRYSAAKELGMPGRSIDYRIAKLKKMGNLARQVATHYSIISIINWDTYQSTEKKVATNLARHLPGSCQAVATNKNDKNDKNIKPTDLDPSKNGKFRFKRSTPWPAGFYITTDMEQFAIKNGIPESHIKTIFDQFKDYSLAKGSTYKDWIAAWRTRIRNEIKYHPDKYKKPYTVKSELVL